MTLDLEPVRRMVAQENGLAVVSVVRSDGTPHASLVNAGVLDHPLGGGPVVGFVAGSATRKLANLRARPVATVVLRAGWRWVAVDGPVELIGPDDRLEGFDPGGLPRLLRDVFTAAGGTHDDWDEYDRVMAEERRTAVLVRPARVYGNS
jgi:PPOX class probable F420-dependent enzyme